MRDIKTLLILLREWIRDAHWIGGLCLEVSEMYKKDVISASECVHLKGYILKHKPTRGKYHEKGRIYNGFYWREGEVLKRQQWVNYLIRNYEIHNKKQ